MWTEQTAASAFWDTAQWSASTSTRTNIAETYRASKDQGGKAGATVSTNAVGVIVFHRDLLWGQTQQIFALMKPKASHSIMHPQQILPAFTPQVFASADTSHWNSSPPLYYQGTPAAILVLCSCTCVRHQLPESLPIFAGAWEPRQQLAQGSAVQDASLDPPTKLSPCPAAWPEGISCLIPTKHTHTWCHHTPHTWFSGSLDPGWQHSHMLHPQVTGFPY